MSRGLQQYISPKSLLLLTPIITLYLLLSSLKIDSIEGYHVDLSPLRKPAKRSLNITIVVVLNSESDPDEYSFSLNTIRCYSAMHKYPLKIVNDSDYSEECRQKDYMFRRHCVAAKILEQSEWILFLDADITVANPNRLIEEFASETSDLTFYDRFAGWEIAMGSYLARNSEWTLKFLKNFADFETKLPESFHGTDNGAIHAFVVIHLLPSLLPSAQPCFSIWNQSTNFESLFLFEACIRTIIGNREHIDKLRIIPKGRGWVRDIWLADSRWSTERDFMLHGTKSSDRATTINPRFRAVMRLFRTRFTWYPILRNELDIEACHSGTIVWDYEPSLIVSQKELEKELSVIHRDVERRKWKILAEVARYV